MKTDVVTRGSHDSWNHLFGTTLQANQSAKLYWHVQCWTVVAYYIAVNDPFSQLMLCRGFTLWFTPDLPARVETKENCIWDAYTTHMDWLLDFSLRARIYCSFRCRSRRHIHPEIFAVILFSFWLSFTCNVFFFSFNLIFFFFFFFFKKKYIKFIRPSIFVL